LTLVDQLNRDESVHSYLCPGARRIRSSFGCCWARSRGLRWHRSDGDATCINARWGCCRRYCTES